METLYVLADLLGLVPLSTGASRESQLQVLGGHRRGFGELQLGEEPLELHGDASVTPIFGVRLVGPGETMANLWGHQRCSWCKSWNDLCCLGSMRSGWGEAAKVPIRSESLAFAH